MKAPCQCSAGAARLLPDDTELLLRESPYAIIAVPLCCWWLCTASLLVRLGLHSALEPSLHEANRGLQERHCVEQWLGLCAHHGPCLTVVLPAVWRPIPAHPHQARSTTRIWIEWGFE